jgi:hypothetical protein
MTFRSAFRASGVAAALTFGAAGPLLGAVAGAGPSVPAASLSASPSRVRVAAGGHSTLQVTNAGAHAVVVTAGPAGYALDLRGRPRIAQSGVVGSSAPWLVVRPRQFRLAPGATVPLTIATALPRHAAPGDHAALIVLATRPADVGRVAVALRLGVVVDVRVPGDVVRRLSLGRMRVRRFASGPTLEVVVANSGNVSELLRSGRLEVTLRRRGRLLAVLRSQGQELLPHTTGIVDLHYRGKVRGRVTAVVRLSRAAGGRSVQRRFELGL